MWVLTRDLPDSIQAALAALGYGRKDIDVEARETVSLACGGGNGYRAFACLVNMATGERKATYGSWGGANMFNPTNVVDLDTRDHAIPVQGAVILGSEGGSRPVYATVYLNPAAIAPLLPASETLSGRDASIMRHAGYKSAYRKEEWARIGVTAAEIDSLVSRGYLARNRAGALSLTTKGRNARQGAA